LSAEGWVVTATVWSGLAGCALALVVGTLVEYVVHRLMHRRILLGRKHAAHHKGGWGQGWLGEFWDYYVGSLPVIVLVLLLAWGLDLPAAGVGFAAGGVFYTMFAAYVHQAQHERPELIFWMRMPIHHVHHAHQMWRHNFGICFDGWDRLFGTYKVVDWQRPFTRPRWRDFLRIEWW
jgi:sterol desaturase/sphingolipid hydroxylase (fatty acid hydroxylase superfamily)